FVIQSEGYWKDRNPSVTATVFINGAGLTTFTAARRQAVITDLLKPGLNEVRLVTEPIRNGVSVNDIRIKILGPADYYAGAGVTKLRPIAWFSANTGWTRDAKTGLLINTVDAKSSRIERVIPLYLPGPVKQAGRFSLDKPQMMVFSKRFWSSSENTLHSELIVNDKTVGLFTSDTQETLAGALKPGQWNVVKLRTKSKYPIVGRSNELQFRFGSVQRALSGNLHMSPILWSFDNGDGWRKRDGKYVHRIRGDASDVTLTFHLFLGERSHEPKPKEAKGNYLLTAAPYSTSQAPSVTATVFVNGTPLTSFAGAKRSVVLKPPLIKKGMNELKVVTKRVDNCLVNNDLKLTLSGPAKYNVAAGGYRYPQIKTFYAQKETGWKRDPKTLQLVNPKQPDSNTLERVFRFEVK
ncbi:MAG: hypothetical protein ACE5KM_13230, partial [Planctomycetaceae bacterium]